MNTKKYSHFFSLSSEMLSIMDFDGYFKELNPSWEKTLGYKNQDLLENSYLDFVHPEDRNSTFLTANSTDPKNTLPTFENRYRCKNGSYRWLRWKFLPVAAEKLIYAVAQDITDHKQAQESILVLKENLEKLTHQQKTQLKHDPASLNHSPPLGFTHEKQFASTVPLGAANLHARGIAHDLNNLLSAILANCSFLLQELNPNDSKYNDIHVIKKVTQRASVLTRQLLPSRQTETLPSKTLDLNSIVAETVELIRHAIHKDIRLTMIYDKTPGVIKTGASQIEQVLINLILNARDALPKGGNIVIETRSVVLDETHEKSGHYLLLLVSDSGLGMDETVQSHLFEPYFSTKTPEKGTGLGLTIVHQIVKQNDGFIEVSSQIGHGTIFKVYFPKLNPAPESSNLKKIL